MALLSALQGWGYYQTLLIYWGEALVIGGYNVLRLLTVGLFGERPLGDWLARSVDVTTGARIGLTLIGTAFFVVKFGGLALVVGFFVVTLPAFLSEAEGSGGASVFRALNAAGQGAAVAVGLLALSHGISFVKNFIGRREYARVDVLSLIFLPYARMSLVALVLAAALVVARAAPGAAGTTAFPVVVILLKLAADAAAHAAEHRWMAALPSAAADRRATAAV